MQRLELDGALLERLAEAAHEIYRAGVHAQTERDATLIPAIDAALEGIEARWPGLPLRLISALAEGSDRLVVERALCRPQAQLLVPLPMPAADYALDFRLPDSQTHFTHLLAQAAEVVYFPPAVTRPAAYTAAGRYMLAHCDLLIALWDGQPAHGDGGTGSVVAEARRCGLPLVWIRAHNHKPGFEKPSYTIVQGKTTFENFDT